MAGKVQVSNYKDQLPQPIMESPAKPSPSRVENLQRNRQSEATPKSLGTNSASFGMTPNEREMMKYRAENDKVVGYYQKVMKDIRHTIKNERKQVQKYLNWTLGFWGFGVSELFDFLNLFLLKKGIL